MAAMRRRVASLTVGNAATLLREILRRERGVRLPDPPPRESHFDGDRRGVPRRGVHEILPFRQDLRAVVQRVLRQIAEGVQRAQRFDTPRVLPANFLRPLFAMRYAARETRTIE